MMTMIPTRMLVASIATLLGSAAALTISIASPALAQDNNPPGPPPHGPMRHADFLNLTDDQKAQLEQIHQNVRSQIDAILTEEQKAQLQRDRENRGPGDGNGDRGPRGGDENRGMPPRPPFDSLNLTEGQRSQIDAIMRAAKEQMDAILTPEQRQQLQEHQQQRQQSRPGNS